MIRNCRDSDFDTIYAVINDAAIAYKGVIPSDCWREPYMSRQRLRQSIADGVDFWASEEEGTVLGVMGVQVVHDVTLIRHAYVRTIYRCHGVGSELLRFLLARIAGPTLVGTWTAAAWAIAFYRRHGFELVGEGDRKRLLQKYWKIPERQIDTSVVLADRRWFDVELNLWVSRYFPAKKTEAAIAILSRYGAESWHYETARVKRDAIIVSRGSLDRLQVTIETAMKDYRDVLVGEEVDSWLIAELKRFQSIR